MKGVTNSNVRHTPEFKQRAVEPCNASGTTFAAVAKDLGVIKSECVHARTFDSRERAALEIFGYIECFCNRVRIHSAIGWMSPTDNEAKMSEEAAKAA